MPLLYASKILQDVIEQQIVPSLKPTTLKFAQLPPSFPAPDLKPTLCGEEDIAKGTKDNCTKNPKMLEGDDMTGNISVRRYV